MISQVTFKFFIGRYNGSMGMDIVYNDSLILSKDSFDTDTFTFSKNLDLPGEVVINIYNKGPVDTLVDNSGNIIADKYIKLEELIVDRLPIHILSLIHLPEVTAPDGQLIRTNYWGFNGPVRIKLEHTDSFLWHLAETKRTTTISDK